MNFLRKYLLRCDLQGILCAINSTPFDIFFNYRVLMRIKISYVIININFLHGFASLLVTTTYVRFVSSLAERARIAVLGSTTY